MKHDIIIIGSGPGGYVAAIRAAQLGKKVAVVECDELGGTCLNWGCIPTKALLKSAQVYAYAKAAAQYGVEVAGEVAPSLPRMVERSRAVAGMMNKGVAFLLDRHKVEIVRGTGRLAGSGRVEVTLHDGGGSVALEADHIVLATGSRPRELGFLPVDGAKVINSRQALALERLPESLIVVGSGAIGCEFADFYATLGVKVTIVEYQPNLLPILDEDISKQIERTFRKKRIGVMTGASVKSVDTSEGLCRVEVETRRGLETLEAEIVLSAVGIRGNVEGIGLEEAGVGVNGDRIPVDEWYQTNIGGIYAIGDLIGPPALAHVASAEALVCIEHICGLDVQPIDYTAIPACVYTTPEVSSVGLSEREATGQGYALRIGKFPYTASGKATAAGDRDGFVKLIFDAATDKLLGAHCVGLSVTEIIAGPTLLRRMGGTAQDLLRTIHPHPTMSEAIMEAAAAACGEAIHI
ncbi:MAG: dihydrolipoyl dehydrogenase [Rikenellaceae bacterium]|nr:dihydrolipoyl dehydrogenase [Rikenellaceae bacterium]